MKRFVLSLMIVLMAIALAACSAPSASDQEAALATIVAATLQAQLSPTDTGEPIDGEIQPQSVYGDCANHEQLSVAYIKDGNIWLWVDGSSATQLTNESDARDLRISDDGCRVAYARQVPNPGHDPSQEFPQPETVSELWVISSDGSGQQRLAGLDLLAGLPAHEGAVNTLHYFEWRPGTRQLAFGTRQAFMGPGLASNGDIYRVHADTLEVSPVLPAGQAGRFAFSPDGQQIAFAGANHVGVAMADGSDLRANLINYPLVITFSEYQYEPPLHWTPQGDLIFALPPEDGLTPPQQGIYPETAIWYLPLDGSQPFQAGGIHTVWFPVQEVAFSPDRGRIAYLRPVGGPDSNERELVIALSNGSNESAWFFQNNILFGAWAPDNERFIYSYEEEGLRLMISDLAGDLAAPVVWPNLARAFSVELDWVSSQAIVAGLLLPDGAELNLIRVDDSVEVIDTLDGLQFMVFDVAD